VKGGGDCEVLMGEACANKSENLPLISFDIPMYKINLIYTEIYNEKF